MGIRPYLLPLIFWLAGSTAFASEENIIDAWYNALKNSDRDMFNELLHDNAVIELKQLGTNQTKSEFLASLDVWDEVVSSLSLSYTWEGVDASSATATVCYQFESNAFTNLEVFIVSEGQILRQEQERLMEGC